MKQKIILLLIIFNTSIAFAFEVDTLIIQSKSMNKLISNIVVLPDNYEIQRGPLPVLYLLHGAGGNYSDWTKKLPEIKNYVNQYNMIIVNPDGGITSWYFDSPIDQKMKYETYISNELIEAIDKKYNTIPDKSGRAITGLSMGGHGAFYLAFKHQDIWGAAGSISGGLDILPFPKGWDLEKRLGEYSKNRINWESNSVINMVYLLKPNSLKLIFDCGVDDFFYDANIRFHNKMKQRNISHEFISRPGSHNWEYFTKSLPYQLLFFNDFFNIIKLN